MIFLKLIDVGSNFFHEGPKERFEAKHFRSVLLIFYEYQKNIFVFSIIAYFTLENDSILKHLRILCVINTDSFARSYWPSSGC